MKVAVVTGASRGIGLAIAESLSDKGYRVVGISRNITQKEPFDFVIQADMSDLAGHPLLVSRIAEKYGRMDVLVNNAGVAPLQRMDILDMQPESFDRLMNINLRGPLFFSQMVANYMLNQGNQPAERNQAGPSIIFITSVSAVASSPERAEYCISKAGLSMAAQVFADRLSATGISVYEIRPGVIFTDMTRAVKEKYDRRISDGLIPQGCWGQPEDIARAVTALATGEIPYATGAVIELSGGMNIRHL